MKSGSNCGSRRSQRQRLKYRSFNSSYLKDVQDILRFLSEIFFKLLRWNRVKQCYKVRKYANPEKKNVKYFGIVKGEFRIIKNETKL